MNTTADKLQLLKDTKEAIKDAIIEKGQSVSDSDPFSSYPNKIGAIQTGANTSDATAVGADIRSGKTAYVKGAKVTGTMEDVAVPLPALSLNSSTGVVTGTAVQGNGYATGGTRSDTLQLPTQAAQTITPGTANKEIAAGKFLTGKQTIAGDADLIAGNIKTGVNIFNVGGTFTSDGTAAASDIVSGKTAYVKGSKVTGSIASKGASDLTSSGATVTVPAGYYSSQVSKSVETATQATPSISVDSAGKITASAAQEAGYVTAGTKSATQQLTTKAATTITPGTAEKTAVASGVYTTGAVKVAGDANLKAANIKSGVSIFGVVGTLTSDGGGDVSLGSGAATLSNSRLMKISGVSKMPSMLSIRTVLSGTFDSTTKGVIHGLVYASDGTNTSATAIANITTTSVGFAIITNSVQLTLEEGTLSIGITSASYTFDTSKSYHVTYI